MLKNVYFLYLNMQIDFHMLCGYIPNIFWPHKSFNLMLPSYMTKKTVHFDIVLCV